MSTILVPLSYTGEGADARPTRGTLEAITAALNVAEEVAVVSVATSGVTEAVADTLSSYGVCTIYRAESEDALNALGTHEVDVVSLLAVQENAAGIILTESVLNKEIAGRLAVRLGSGLASDAVGITDPHHVRHSIFGSQLDVEVELKGNCPVVVLRSGVVELPEGTHTGSATITDVDIPAATERRMVKVTAIEEEESSDRPGLTQADIVVAGGRGVGSEENFHKYVDSLADALGAAVGATRAAVDAEFCPGSYQIGQTGVTVTPKLYIGLGIAGAIQHKGGMQNSQHIVVVNNDPDAQLFDIADLGIIGNVEDVVPALLDLLKADE